MKQTIIVFIALFSIQFCAAQNVGIGTTIPIQKLDVNGIVRSKGLMVTNGSQSDVLKKGGGDSIVFSKGNTGLGLNYIISLYGIFPPQSGPANYNNVIVGEIRLFAGNYAPTGFAFCQGQLLQISDNNTLFFLLGTTYGGDGITTFALPDLRGAVPVGFGTASSGQTWNLGQKSN